MYDNILKKIGLSGFVLKWLAILTMAIDHVGAVLFPELLWLRYIGRLSFPIFCFLMAEGFFYTRSRGKYILRLLLFAFASEIPFDLAFSGQFLDFSHQNIFFTLLIAFGIMMILSADVLTVIKLSALGAGIFLTEFIGADYGGLGVVQVLCFYFFRKHILIKSASVVVVNFSMSRFVQPYGGFAVLPIALYNGKKGPGMKYFFYLFYPIHLLLLMLLKQI